MDLEQQLYDDYTAYWARTGAVRKVAARLRKLPPKPQLTRERRGRLRDMVLFCLDHGADPRIWLYTLFVARNWTYAPKWECLTPKAHVKRYRKEQRLGSFRDALDQQRRARRSAQADTFDPNVDVAAHVEALKGELVRTGRTDACMAKMQAETFGYHPKSQVCAGCPAQAVCCDALQRSMGFDIVALRRGDLSVDQAREALRAATLAKLPPKDLIYGRP